MQILYLCKEIDYQKFVGYGRMIHMEKNLTTGSVFKNLVLFSLPYLLSYFLQTLYGMADLFIIGQFEGVASTTAVSVGSQVMHMLTVMIVGLAMGTTVSIAQNIGAGDRRKAAQAVGNTVVLFVSVSVALTVLLLLLVRHIVSVMSTPAEAVEGTVEYLTVCFIGIPFITAYNIISSIFRGMGDSRSPMYFIAIACVTNIALDYVFMGALHLGPVGAALGTTVSQAASVAISLFVIRRRHSIPLEKKDFKPEKSVIGKILKIGVAIACVTNIALDYVFMGALHLGPVGAALGTTVSALGAQNIGADKPERARLTLRYAILLAAGFGLIVSVLIQFSAEPIVALFTDKEAAGGAEVIRLGGQYLRGYIWDCLFAGIHFSFSGYFCACGKSGLSFLHNIIAIMFVRVPGVYLTSNLFPTTLFPMGLATATGSFLSVVICVIAFAVITKNRDENQHSGWGGKRKF